MTGVTAEPVLGVARTFFEACETGRGWEACKRFCTPDATFSAQTGVLEGVQTVQQYTDWMKSMMAVLPDGSYEVKSFALDADRNNVVAYGVFSGTHTGEGGPVAATGKSMKTDYVYVMDFQGSRISHMTKIWNDGVAVRQLGWAGQ